METACGFFETRLTDEHRVFLQERYGLTPNTIRQQRIGYAPPSGSALILHLLDHDYSADEIIGSGLVYRRDTDEQTITKDLFRGRLIFPYLVSGRPAYFIGRSTDETPASHERPAPKYIKQIVTPTGPQEPTFGIDTLRTGTPLLITEGVTDAIACHQAGYSCISPVTTSFKESRIRDAIQYCKLASKTFILNDSEENRAGDLGAARTALAMIEIAAINPMIGSIPRPENVEKVDLNDFLRGGGSISDLLHNATPAMDHPTVKELIDQSYRAAATHIRATLPKRNPGWITRGSKNREDIGDLKDRMPTISQISGVPPGAQGVHPVFGSSTGKNFLVSKDGETWTSFHGGPKQGRSGGVFKLVALMQGFLTDEDQPLRGEAFKKTVEHCRKTWGGVKNA
ncbi:MAG: DNA primase [Methanocalculus sp. MSAO_Arc2]|nr:MAG: DNA primase [Methanocalculus sp. MSAO_Arc2]